MPSIDASLTRLLHDTPGVTQVALVDGVTGLPYGGAGDDTGPDGATAAAELALLIGERLRAAGADSALESVVLTGARRHLVLRSVPHTGDPLLLTAVLDREQANLALALRRLDRLAADVLA
ncbi:hypothetical protein ACFV6E_34780 [Streptomyces sp. NPDC059785]|uniref:hypothetical protein n=1 Tax=unclassified Streptomyces TaxID=2593676 RepID=UPI003661FACB